MTKPEVLIIGAGPTGLMAACQLAMRKISFRIIDKTEDHTTQSRALVIHARSLEIFQQMGLAEQALQHGRIARAVNLVVNGKKKLRLGISDIGNNLTDFPFLLILEQSKTEMILNECLTRFGHKVERNTELISISQNQNNVTAIIQRPDGKEETIEANWLIGADGTHSIVRKDLKIPFLGKIYQHSLFVLDCKVDLQLPPDELYVSFSNETFALFVPMSNGRCRVIGLIPKEFQDKEDISFEDVNKSFARRTHINLTLQDPEWIAKYNAHHRVVSAFRDGQCFLAGDAAHIHSPVGAQGMNTGLQDAYNLSWKLALVIQDKAKENLLDTYEEERLRIAKKLVKTTDKVFNVVTGESGMLKIFRMQFVPLFLKLILPFARGFSSIRKFAFVNISQIAIHYRDSKLSQEDSSASYFENKPVMAGDRVPFNFMRNEITKGNNFHLLLFSHEALSENVLQEFQDACKGYGIIIILHLVSFNKSTESVFKQFGVKDIGMCLIRPDSYIAFKSTTVNIEKLNEYLDRFFLSTRDMENIYD